MIKSLIELGMARLIIGVNSSYSTCYGICRLYVTFLPSRIS
jgi:hypothetical protein